MTREVEFLSVSLPLSFFLCGRITSLDRARHVIGRHCPRDPQRSQTKDSSVMVPHCLSACLRYPREAGLRCANFDPWHELSTSPFLSLTLHPCLSLLLHPACVPLVCFSLRLGISLALVSFTRVLRVSPNDDSIKLSRLNAIIANSPRGSEPDSNARLAHQMIEKNK